jgi:hypothetical protein
MATRRKKKKREAFLRAFLSRNRSYLDTFHHATYNNAKGYNNSKED